MLERGGIAGKSSASSSTAQPADVTFGYRWRGVWSQRCGRAARLGIGAGEPGRKGKNALKGTWRRRLMDDMSSVLHGINLYLFKC